MPKDYKKISVFIDTNLLQSFIKHDKRDYVFLAELGIPKDYYDLVSFITNNRLQDHVEICIPEVVFRELRQHMINAFNSFCDSVASEMKFYDKIAKDLFSCSYSIKPRKEDYPGYVDTLIDGFIKGPQNRCKYIPVASKERLLDTLLDKSLRGVKPFTAQSIDGKTYKDAGFRDSVIAETIYEYCSKEGRKCLLISKDADFGPRFEDTLNDTSEYVRCPSFERAIELLEKYYETSVEDRLKREFTENTYLLERLLSSVGQAYDASVTRVAVNDIRQQEDEQYNVDLTITVNEADYCFAVVFDTVANDILDFRYKIEND